MKHPRAVAATAASLALIAVGCGASARSSSTATAPQASVAASTSPAASPALPGPTITTKLGKLGMILATGPKERTLYLFEADKGSRSSCTGACERIWPPLNAPGGAKVAGRALGQKLGTITRPDGSRQVTYGGHPLYLYSRDGDLSDAYGQGIKSFGAAWYVLSPSGSKVDRS